MKPKDIPICTVVTGRTLDEFLANLEKVQEISDFVELRLDYIKNLSEKDIEEVKKRTKTKSIFTCRKTDEGGFYEDDDIERKKIVMKAVEMNFDYIDIELSSINQFDDLIKSHDAEIILSFHDFEGTPSYENLEQIKETMKQYPKTIMKFATMVYEERDTKNLYKLLINKQDTEKMIVLGMGEKGKATRILGPLLGSYLTFASSPYSHSAPGQIDIIELKKIYTAIVKTEDYETNQE